MDAGLQYFKPHATRIEMTFAEEIASSLGGQPRHINPKFFYDQRGSELFEEICTLPEYYLTRTEIALLGRLQDDLPSYMGGRDLRLVELGSGASVKTRLILDLMTSRQDRTQYFPIDISEILAESSERLLRRYDTLQITGIIDTYEGGLEFLRDYDDRRNLIIFLGSSFGNLSPEGGRAFLGGISSMMKPDDLFLIGLDLVKDRGTLESAYNDSRGVTARFNLNVLSRINDELDADFNLANFAHHAAYNGGRQRIEMGLRSLADQSVVISKCNMELSLGRGEMIRTEHSYKYTPSQIRCLLGDAGLGVERMWTDGGRRFSLTMASPKGGGGG